MFRPIPTCRRQFLSLQPPVLTIRHVTIRHTASASPIESNVPSHVPAVDGPAEPPCRRSISEEHSKLLERGRTSGGSAKKLAFHSQEQWRPKRADIKPEIHAYQASRPTPPSRPPQEEMDQENETSIYRPDDIIPGSNHQSRPVPHHGGEHEQEADYRPSGSACPSVGRNSHRNMHPSERSLRHEGRGEGGEVYRPRDFSQELGRRGERELPYSSFNEEERRPPRISRHEEESRPRRDRRPSRRGAPAARASRLAPGGDANRPHNYEEPSRRPDVNPWPRSYDPRTDSGLKNPVFPLIHQPGNPFSHAVSARNSRTVLVMVDGTIHIDRGGFLRSGIACYFGPMSPHNIQRRLGLPHEPYLQSGRAALESALAALKVLAKELSEDITVGEIVVVTKSQFLHRTMTDWVPELKAAGWLDWKGNTVPNSDLIQELEEVVVGLEKEGVEVKFWIVAKQFTIEASVLAEQACFLPLQEECKASAVARGGSGEAEETGNPGKLGKIGVLGWSGVAAVVVSAPALIMLEWPLL